MNRKPFETSYKRWRHLKHLYVVEVLGVQNYRGEVGYYSTVTVLGSIHDPKKKAVWPAGTFRKCFEPIGRKRRAKTALEIVLEDKGRG